MEFGITIIKKAYVNGVMHRTEDHEKFTAMSFEDAIDYTKRKYIKDNDVIEFVQESIEYASWRTEYHFGKMKRSGFMVKLERIDDCPEEWKDDWMK